MLYKRKSVEVRPQRIAAVPVIEEHHHEHPVVVERSVWSSEATAVAVIAGLALFGLLLYFLWYRPTVVQVTPTPSVVEHRVEVKDPSPAPTTVIQTPPPATSNPIIVNPPANNASDTPNVQIDNNVTTPPTDHEESESGASDHPADTDTTEPTDSTTP